MAGRRGARILAALLGGLSVAGGGTLAAAGVAWSAGGRQQAHHTTTSAQTTTTTTQTTAQATGTPGHKANGSSSAKPKASGSGKSGSAKKPKPKPVVRLSAALLSAIAFPERALGLWTSPSMPLAPGQVHVTENGRPVSGLKLTPLSQVPSGDFGVVVVLDESSAVNPALLGLEQSTAAAIAAQRRGSEEVGLVSFGSSPTVMLPLTTNSTLISNAFDNPPLVAPGSSLLPALALAYSQLQQARVPVGAVVVLTAGKTLASPAAEAAASQAGLRLGYQTFVSDVARPSPGAVSSGQPDTDAQQERALGQELSAGSGLWSRLTSGYEVSYRSGARPRQNVTVSVAVNGVSGTASMQYTASPSPSSGLVAPSLAALRRFPILARYPGFAQYFPGSAPVRPTRAAPTFWSSPLSLVLVSVACALLLAGALLLLVSGVRESGVETRVSGFIPQEESTDEQTSLVLASPGAPAILARRRWWPKFVLEVDVARFRRSPVSLVRRAIGGSLMAGVVFTLVLGSIAGFLVGLPLGPLVLYAVVRRAARKNRARFAEQLPSYLQDMAGAMRGGRSMAGAVKAAADGAAEPSLGEFERVVADEQLGRPLETTLHNVAQRMRSEDMEQVALVATLHRRSGSSVAEALDHVAEGARERLELIRELKSLTGQARLSSRILTALPLALIVVLNLIAPGYMSPLTHTTGGIVVIVICAFMVGMGWLALRRIVKVEA